MGEPCILWYIKITQTTWSSKLCWSVAALACWKLEIITTFCFQPLVVNQALRWTPGDRLFIFSTGSGEACVQQASCQQELLLGHCMFHPDWSAITRGLAYTNPDICAPSAAGVRLLGLHKGPEVNDGFVRSRVSEGWCMANQTLIIIGQGQGSWA